MLVIVEGPDGSGKSTLVRKIRELPLPQQFWCLSSARRYRTTDDVARFLAWIKLRPDLVRLVFDRFPIISEWIYGPILRNSYFDIPKSRYIFLDPHEAALHMAKALLRLDPDPLVIYCCPPFQVLIEKVKQEPQMDGVIENIRIIYDRYKLLMDELQSKVKVNQIDPFSENCLQRLEGFFHDLRT